MPVFTKSGKLSAKISARCTVKRAYKIEQVARLTAEGFKDDAIALVLGCTKVYVSMLRRTPEYLSVEATVRTGLIARADRHLFMTEDAQRATLEEMVPEALEVIKFRLLDRSNPRLQFEAAKELLDREGTHAKVSKTEIKSKVEYDFSKHDKEIDDDLLSLLQGNNSKTAISEDNIEDFINTKLNPEEQELLHKAVEDIRLEDLKTSKTVN